MLCPVEQVCNVILLVGIWKTVIQGGSGEDVATYFMLVVEEVAKKPEEKIINKGCSWRER